MDKRVHSIKIYTNTKEKSKLVEKELKRELENYSFLIDDHNYDMGISIGGDGTFLKMVHDSDFKDIYYAGINTGSLGFLQETQIKDCLPFILRLKENDYDIEDLDVGEVVITINSSEYHYFFLNEVIIRNQCLRTLESKVIINDNLLEEFAGDAILISTNTGSTAHNMSYHGPILYHSLSAFIITPIAPIKNNVYHNLDNSIVIPGNSKITLIPNKTDVFITIDGISIEQRGVVQIEVKMANKKIKKLKFQDTSFIKIVHDKLL